MKTTDATMRCSYCRSNTHSDAQCHSTRPAADVHNLGREYVKVQMRPMLAALAAPAPQPEPLFWCRVHPDGTPTHDVLPDAVIEDVRKRSGAWMPLGRITAPSAGDAARPEIDRLNSERLDLACLVLRLIRRMRAARAGEGMAAGDDALEQQARGYLQRKGLSANPLRDGDDEIEYHSVEATCEWHHDDDGLWQSACGGDPWLFEAEDPTKNGMRFCIHCGKRMVQAAPEGKQP